MQKIPIIFSDYYNVSLEVVMYEGKASLFIHADVNAWNIRIYKELEEQWELFRSLNTQPIYAVPNTENTSKFAEMFGFEYVNDKIMRHMPWADGSESK